MYRSQRIIDHPTNIAKFATYATKQKVSAFIRPDNSVFKRWRVVRHKTREGILIQFKAEHCGPLGTKHVLLFDEKRNTLTLTHLEPELVKKIKETKE